MTQCESGLLNLISGATSFGIFVRRLTSHSPPRSTAHLPAGAWQEQEDAMTRDVVPFRAPLLIAIY